MQNYVYIIVPSVAWILAQTVKYAISLRKDGLDWGDIVQSGGIPSAHSTFVTSLTTAVGLVEGVKSAAFGIALALTGVVIYDSMGVRRTTGEQTDALKELAKRGNKPLLTRIHNARGHNVVDVVAGCGIGFSIAYIYYLTAYNL